MSQKHTPTITEILARLNKAAEDASEADVAKETPPQAEVGAEEKASEPCNEPACHGMITNTEENKPGDSDSLESIAKEAALYHRDALQKEAATFGKLFAGAMLGQFKAAAEGAEVPTNEPDDAEIGKEEKKPGDPCPKLTNDAEEAGVAVTNDEAKTAELLIELGYEKLAEIQEDAYMQTLCKLAADEAYDMALEAVNETPSLGDVATAVKASATAAANAAQAANTLADAVATDTGETEAAETEAADVDPEVVQDAYDQTVAAVNGDDDDEEDDEGEDADVDPEVAQAAYNQAVDALGGATPGIDPEVAQDAYNQALTTLQGGVQQ